MGEETEPTQTARKLRNPDAFTWTVKTLNTTDLFHTFPLGWSTNFLTWLPLHRRKQGEWGKLREETEESSRNSSIPAIRNYSSCYFQHLQTVKSMVPKCHSAGGKEILLHENLQTRHSCQNSGHGRRSKRGEGNEAKVDKKNFGNSILPMNEFFVSLQTPVKMVPDARRSTTETRFYCTQKTHKTTILVKNKVTKTNQKRACEEGEIDGAEIQKKNLRNPERSREPWNFQIRTYHTWPRTRIILQLTTNHSIARKLITHHSRQKWRSKNLKFNISKEKSPSGAKV